MFGHLLREMRKVKNSVEVSFVSKLMATVDPNLPVRDKYVLQNLHMEDKWKAAEYRDTDTRILLAEDIYQRICVCYSGFLSTKDGELCIAAFDDALPKYKEELTPVKKIDFLLWSKRESGIICEGSYGTL